MLEVLGDQLRGAFPTAAITIALLYIFGVPIYRLYWSPIAKFPGPKLAAVTYLYELYYDIVKRGKYTFKIEELHAKYGSPNYQGQECIVIANLNLQDLSFVLILQSSTSTIPIITTAYITERESGRRTHITPTRLGI